MSQIWQLYRKGVYQFAEQIDGLKIFKQKEIYFSGNQLPLVL